MGEKLWLHSFVTVAIPYMEVSGLYHVPAALCAGKTIKIALDVLEQ